MRKRHQFQSPSPQKRIPTLIIMCVVLFVILYFGKTISWNIATFFEPSVPVTDLPADETSSPGAAPSMPAAPSNASTIPAQANRKAARNILNILPKGQNP